MRVETDLDRAVRTALAEDVGTGDVTTEGVVDELATCRAQLLLKEPGIVCGLDVAAAVFESLDPAVAFDPENGDGDEIVVAPARLAVVDGPARAIRRGLVPLPASHTLGEVVEVSQDLLRLLPGRIPSGGAGRAASTRATRNRPGRIGRWLNW